MESTVAEVLILKELEEVWFYKLVNGVGRKILMEFEGLRGGGASLSGARTEADPEKHMYYNILLLFVKNKLQVVCLVRVDGTERAGRMGDRRKKQDPPLHESNPQGWATPSEKGKVSSPAKDAPPA